MRSRSVAAVALLSLLFHPLAGAAAEQAGVSAAVRGAVKLTRETLVGQQLESGEDLFLQDSIDSGVDSGMQIMLLDETVFTLGSDSSIVIDEFIYDPASGAGTVTAQVVKGAFRFVTGKVARNRPEDMNVRLPAGNIGIRGTIVAGLSDPADRSSLVVLLGPGRDNNTGDRPGRVVVSNAGVSVELRRPNWATRIPGAGQPPLAPFRIGPGELDAVLGRLAAGEPPPGETAADLGRGSLVWETSGQAAAQGQGNAGQVDDLDPFADVLDDRGQDAIVSSEVTRTTNAQLDALSLGSATYSVAGVPLSDGGSYDFSLLLDFGFQTADFDVDNIVSPALLLGTPASFDPPPFDYSQFLLGPPDDVPVIGASGFLSAEGCGPSGSCDASVGSTFLNLGDRLAARAVGGLAITDAESGVTPEQLTDVVVDGLLGIPNTNPDIVSGTTPVIPGDFQTLRDQ